MIISTYFNINIDIIKITTNINIRLSIELGVRLGIGSISRSLISINIKDLSINDLLFLDIKLATLDIILYFLDDEGIV